MKVRVIKDFRDKYTKKIHKTGEILEITKERYEEINSTAHGIFAKEMPEDQKEKKKTKSTKRK
jgi:hypothetical protein